MRMTMPRKVIVPGCPYSPGIRADNVLYVTGAPALDSNGDPVGIGHAKVQTRQLAQTIKAVMETAGGSIKDVTLNRIRGPECGLSRVFSRRFAGPMRHWRCTRAAGILVGISSIGQLRWGRTSGEVESTMRQTAGIASISIGKFFFDQPINDQQRLGRRSARPPIECANRNDRPVNAHRITVWRFSAAAPPFTFATQE
jgi:aminoacrylate peracid reductase